jgi:hypothetical protein
MIEFEAAAGVCGVVGLVKGTKASRPRSLGRSTRRGSKTLDPSEAIRPASEPERGVAGFGPGPGGRDLFTAKNVPHPN